MLKEFTNNGGILQSIRLGGGGGRIHTKKELRQVDEHEYSYSKTYIYTVYGISPASKGLRPHLSISPTVLPWRWLAVRLVGSWQPDHEPVIQNSIGVSKRAQPSMPVRLVVSGLACIGDLCPRMISWSALLRESRSVLTGLSIRFHTRKVGGICPACVFFYLFHSLSSNLN